jgi:predicted RNA-binding Zn-ribbon protein involved in translation (DUF1610 family)
MDVKVVFGLIAAVVCFFFGAVFALASVYAPIRLAVAALLFIVGFGILAIIFVFFRKPSEVVQRIELSGEMKAVPIQCPKCGASIPPSKIKIMDGVPYVTCGYCGNTVEVAEEPKW